MNPYDQEENRPQKRVSVWVVAVIVAVALLPGLMLVLLCPEQDELPGAKNPEADLTSKRSCAIMK